MRKAYLVRYSEPAVKGRFTRSRMTSRLVSNIKKALKFNNVNDFSIQQIDARILVEVEEFRKEIEDVLRKVFGIKSYSPVYVVDSSDLEYLSKIVYELFSSKVRGKEFMVRVRRVGTHPYTSKDAERIIGGYLYEKIKDLKVNLTNPEYVIYLEIRGDKAFLFDQIIPGPGGLPLGSESRVLILFSGGFDSSVASWMIMKRGSPVDFIYYDFGSEENWNIALEVADKLARDHIMNQANTRIYKVDFHETVNNVTKLVRKNYRVLVIRRLMIQHAAKLALSRGYLTVATGESLGQVSSQTIESIYVTSAHMQLPVLRPLISFDKDEIIEVSRRLGIYELSSKQREFCAVTGAYPTPRPDPQLFNEEYLKASMIIEDIWPPKIEVTELPT